jgi:trehalose synthase
MSEVNIGARSVAPFAELLGEARIAALREGAGTLHDKLGARAVWNVNSTRAGGGVAEMLQSSLRYARGLGIAARWWVMEAPPEFFRVTKRVHNALHGSEGDGSPLGAEQHALFE